MTRKARLFAVLLLAVVLLSAPGCCPPLASTDVLHGNPNTIVVSSADGDYTRLSDALKSIHDASKDKRYTILVIGRVNEQDIIEAKSYVDIKGFGAEIVIDKHYSTLNTHDIWAYDVSGTTWKDLTFVSQGETQQPVRVIRIGGNTDSTFVLENCRFINNVSNTLDNNVGIIISDLSKPVLRDCVGQAGVGNYSYGINICGASSPTLYQCTGIGGITGYNGHGILNCESSHALLVSCVGLQGIGGKQSYGLPIIDQASPVMTGCTGKYQTLDYYWDYRSIENESYQPIKGKPYQVNSLSIIVNQAATAGATLDIGTTPGGSEIASDISIYSVTRYPPFEFKRAALPVDGRIYATPSTKILDGSVSIYLSVIVNFEPCFGMYLRTVGYPVIANCVFLSNGNSDALNIGNDITSAQNWKFSNCHFETLDPQNRAAVSAVNQLSNANFYNCTFIGVVTNVSLIQGKP